MPTDVAHIVIFHPDDLAHAAVWPIAWYAEPFIYPVESAEGRLIAWSTRSDGSFDVRLTDGPLTEREIRFRGPEWVFPYTVRHGRVFLDNADTLPGEAQMTQTSENEDYWIEVPNGDYAVTVTAIEWEAEPGSDQNGFETLPNYVVRFEALDGRRIAAAKRPPDLVGDMSAEATDEAYAYPPRTPEPVDFARLYPAFASAHVTRAGQNFYSRGEAPVEAAIPPGADGFELFEQPFVIAAEMAPDADAVIAECHGSGGVPGEAHRYSFRALQPVRIVAIEGGFRNGAHLPPRKTGLFRRRDLPLPADALAAVRIAPVPDQPDEGTGDGLGVLKLRVLEDLGTGGPLAQRLGGMAEYERRRLASFARAGDVTDWLIDNLPLPAAARLRIAARPPLARTDALSAAYERMAQPG